MVIVVVFLCVALLACVLQMRNLSSQMSELRHTEHIRQAFLRLVSRDIRTPLETVGKLAKVIVDEKVCLSKSEKRNISDQLIYNADLVSTILEELMVMGDWGQGHELKVEEFSPNVICQRCLDSIVHSNVHPDLRIQFKHSLSDQLFIHSDPHIVELVLSKLIRNACRFTEKGEVVVGCSDTENAKRLTIYVQDTGVGIPEDRKGSMFNWFDKAEDLENDIEIDLSITQKLATKIGGIVRLDEYYHQGTRMLFILPLR